MLLRNLLVCFFCGTAVIFSSATHAQIWLSEPFTYHTEAIPNGDTLIYYGYSGDSYRLTSFEWSTGQYHHAWLSDSVQKLFPLHLLPNGDVIAAYDRFYPDTFFYESMFKKFSGGSLTDTYIIADPANTCRILAIAYTDTNTLVYHSACGGQNGYVIALDANFGNPDTLVADLTANFSLQMSRQLALRAPDEIQITGILQPFSTTDYALHRYSVNTNIPLVIEMNYPSWIQQIDQNTEPNLYNIKNTLGYKNFDVFGFNAQYFINFFNQEMIGVLQLDAAGFPQRSYTYRDPAGHDYIFADLCKTSDGGFLLLANRGENSSFYTFPPGEGILLQKLNDTLGLEWSRFFPGPEGNSFFSGFFIFPFQNGYCIQGWGTPDRNFQSFFLLLDENGVISSIDETNRSENLLLFPNPNNGSFQLTWPQEKILSVEIYTLSGACVYKQNAFGNESLSIDLNLSNGVYFIHAVNANGNRVVEKVVIAK